MGEADVLRHGRVAIVGLGLMGGSLALALRGQCALLLGIDADPQAVALALQQQVVDQASTRAEELLPEADVIVLATPVRAIIALLGELPALHPGAAVVLDLGSTKVQVMAAMQALPARFDPLGGHPMCGKERLKLANAEAALFQGAPFALTALPRTSTRARTLAEQMVKAIGATPLWIEADIHDRWVAATSHLPYLIANALAYITPDQAQPLVGPGLRSTTRLAATPLSMMRDVLITNQANLIEELQRFGDHLELLRNCLEQGEWGRLEEILMKGASHYDEYIRNWLVSREGQDNSYE